MAPASPWREHRDSRLTFSCSMSKILSQEHRSTHHAYPKAATLGTCDEPQHPPHAPLPGYLCNQCKDAPAVHCNPYLRGERWACVQPVRQGDTGKSPLTTLTIGDTPMLSASPRGEDDAGMADAGYRHDAFLG